MKRTVGFMAALLLAAPAFAGKTYQVTGPVVDVSPTSITVEKGKEKWEIARDAGTKGGADVKKGDKVTVEYKMTATSIEAKGGKAKGDEKGKGEAKGKDKK
ncbi:MAG: hypothetical protein EPN55_07685 [Gammaproteobacteria bacterium]|nr:MAG: hypothetical protein EPN55_07685 [Gammaproteobacteria bacterium]